jgi:hypothetical protein
MLRRDLLLASLAAPLPAWAHHGWSSFDQNRPLFLQGKVVKSTWQNPHAELMLEVPADLKVPTDLASWPVPAQTSPVDGKGLLARATTPRRKDRQWEIELAPLTRLESWRVQPIKVGDSIAVLGYAFKNEEGSAILRVEYLYVNGQAYGLRSSPA